jgi:hypothetical protein
MAATRKSTKRTAGKKRSSATRASSKKRSTKKRSARKTASKRATKSRVVKAAKGGLETVRQAGERTWETLKSTTAQVVEGVRDRI